MEGWLLAILMTFIIVGFGVAVFCGTTDDNKFSIDELFANIGGFFKKTFQKKTLYDIAFWVKVILIFAVLTMITTCYHSCLTDASSYRQGEFNEWTGEPTNKTPFGY